MVIQRVKGIFFLLLTLMNVADLIQQFHQANVVIKFFNNTYRVLNLKGNQSGTFPNCEDLFHTKGTHIQILKIRSTNIDEIDNEELQKLPNLETLDITRNLRLRKIHSKTFEHNPKLFHVTLKSNSIDFIASNVFGALSKEKNMNGELDLSFNKLQHIPIFTRMVPSLKTLKLDGNPIKQLPQTAFQNLTHLEHLSIKNTLIEEIPSDVFSNNIHLHSVNFSNNKQLERIGQDAFVGAKNLRELDLSNTGISHLPNRGLERLTHLYLKYTPDLWEISDGIVAIPTLQTVHVASHQRWLCCAFEMKRSIILTTHRKQKIKITNGCEKSTTTATTPLTSTITDGKSFRHPTTTKTTSLTEEAVTSSSTESSFRFVGRKRRGLGINIGFTSNETFQLSPTDHSETDDNDFIDPNLLPNPVTHHSSGLICNPNVTRDVYNEEQFASTLCSPEPDALRPCDDIMGNVFLTSISWLFSVIGLLGNAMVFCVLMLSRRTVTVTKFLLINLSFADLMLAFYLFILVSASQHTHGIYYNYVREWQYGGGCSIAGFLAVFSSQLSMLVLVVITVERYFAIVYAMHFHRRVSMKHAVICMLFAWFVAVLMGILPLLGVNSFSDVAICLPFRIESSSDKAYIGLLLMMNLLLFVFVFFSYIRMFFVVRSPHLNNAPQRNDSDVAKRMALLVFTDFFCWGPIAFVGLVSAFGGADGLGITVKNSKFLLVIFFPINALCNPFLYAVSTNSFKRDFYDLLIRCGLCQEWIARANGSMYTNNSTSHKPTTPDPLSISHGRNSTENRSSLMNRFFSKRKPETDVKTCTPNSHLTDIKTPPTPPTPDIGGSFECSDATSTLLSSKNTTEEVHDINKNLNETIHEWVRDEEKSPSFSEYDLSPQAFRNAEKSTNV